MFNKFKTWYPYLPYQFDKIFLSFIKLHLHYKIGRTPRYVIDIFVYSEIKILDLSLST